MAHTFTTGAWTPSTAPKFVFDEGSTTTDEYERGLTTVDPPTDEYVDQLVAYQQRRGSPPQSLSPCLYRLPHHRAKLERELLMAPKKSTELGRRRSTTAEDYREAYANFSERVLRMQAQLDNRMNEAYERGRAFLLNRYDESRRNSGLVRCERCSFEWDGNAQHDCLTAVTIDEEVEYDDEGNPTGVVDTTAADADDTIDLTCDESPLPISTADEEDEYDADVEQPTPVKNKRTSSPSLIAADRPARASTPLSRYAVEDVSDASEDDEEEVARALLDLQEAVRDGDFELVLTDETVEELTGLNDDLLARWDRAEEKAKRARYNLRKALESTERVRRTLDDSFMSKADGAARAYFERRLKVVEELARQAKEDYGWLRYQAEELEREYDERQADSDLPPARKKSKAAAAKE